MAEDPGAGKRAGRPSPAYVRALRLLLPIVCCLALAAWFQRPDGRLRVTLLETPGDALLIQLPDGRFALMDGGRDPARLTLLLGQAMPFWRRDLAAVLLTRADGRRLPGQVAALARYRPALVLAPPGMPAGGMAEEWRRLVHELGAPVGELRAGQRLSLGGATVQVLAVERGDEGGAVLQIVYGATRVLVHSGGPAGDAAAERAAGPPLAMLVYPWQRELDTPTVAALAPRAIAFSAAYESEEPALLSYADRRRLSPQIYHPANDGAVSFVSDGRWAWIETEK
jgi:hypothetical protein